MIAFLSILSAVVSGNCKSDDPDFCGSNVISQPIRSCTEGFYYDEHEKCCVAEIVYEPLLRCPNGGVPTPDGMCVCESAPMSTCPDGFRFDKFADQCVRSNMVPMIPSCSHRPDLGGELTEDGRQCFYFREAPPRLSCPKGSKLRDGMCISYELVPGSDFLQCPDGWDLDQMSQECVLVEQVDCKKQKGRKCTKTVVHDCEYEDFQSCDDCVMYDDHHRHLCDGVNCKPKVKPEHLCQAASCKMWVKDKQSKVKSKSFVEPVVCERVTSVPAKHVCTGGGKYNKGKGGCCHENVYPATESCSGGQLTGNGSCLRKVHYVADHVCPMPFEVSCGRDKSSKKSKKAVAHPGACECVARDYVGCIPTCPDGWDFYPETSRCVQMTPAVAYCPERDAQFLDGMCHRVEREPARLEYTVSYVTEQPCEFEDCIKNKVGIKKRKVTHKEVHMKAGKTKTKCHEKGVCVNQYGEPVVEPFYDDHYDVDHYDGGHFFL